MFEVAIVVMAVLDWVMQRTLMGKAMRAVAHDQRIASLMGINCQSASKIDPLTACNFDPPGGASRERARPIAP
jgi:branched-subunit amino acid ABC-type transport system permease component